MTPTDKRAIALLVRYGGASSTTRGYWLCGGHRIAQVTVRRLVRSGHARPCPEHPCGRCLPTDAAVSAADTRHLPRSWREVLEDEAVAAGTFCNYRPYDPEDEPEPLPERRDAHDGPVPLDQLIGGDE